MGDVPAAARRLDAALEWAPTGRRAVPVIVVLVVVADHVGVGTVALLLIGLSAGAHDPAGGRAVIVLTALGYLAVALPLGLLVGLRLQRPTAAWLAAGRRPTPSDAVRAAAELDLGVGVACGQVWAGQVGAASRLEYTVIGDPVNEAARRTDLAKDATGRVVASEEAVRAARSGEGRHWPPGAVTELRGRHRPTRTWVLHPD